MLDLQDIHRYLERNRAHYALLRGNQDYLNSAGFSCRDKRYEDIPLPEDRDDVAAILRKLEGERADLASQTVTTCIDKLKVSIFIVSLQEELALRTTVGNVQRPKAQDLKKISEVLSHAETLKGRLDDRGFYRTNDSRILSSFFDAVREHSIDAVPMTVMEMDDAELLHALFEKRSEMAVHTIHGIGIGMSEANLLQTATLQLEIAVQQKILADDEVSRETIQSYKLSATRNLNLAKNGFGNVELFLAGLDEMINNGPKGPVVAKDVSLPLSMLP